MRGSVAYIVVAFVLCGVLTGCVNKASFEVLEKRLYGKVEEDPASVELPEGGDVASLKDGFASAQAKTAQLESQFKTALPTMGKALDIFIDNLEAERAYHEQQEERLATAIKELRKARGGK